MVRCGVEVAGAAGNMAQAPNVVASKARLDICQLVRQAFLRALKRRQYLWRRFDGPENHWLLLHL
jgi:hypothetical protein